MPERPSSGSGATGPGPDWAREIRSRLAPLALSPTRESEIVEELSQHLDDRWRELVAGGTAPDEAERLTLADFRDGHLAQLMSPLRQSHYTPPITPGTSNSNLLGDLWQDLRHAKRTMVARPAFSAVAVLSLALGIGANAAIFGLWSGLLHRTLPGVEHPEQLVILSNPEDSGGWTGRVDGERKWLTYQEFETIRDRAEIFTGVFASQSSLGSWRIRLDDGTSEEASGRLVSGSFFDVLGARAAIGRVFTADDDRVVQPHVVISDSYWRRRFDGRPDVLGKSIVVGQTALTVTGVAARGFIGETSGQQPDLWLPLRLQPVLQPGRDRLHDTPPTKSMWLHVFARLRPDVTLAQAEARANVLLQSELRSFYGDAAVESRRELLDQRLRVHPGGQGASPARHELSQPLTALFVAVVVLLLITCANLANLLLAHGSARLPEIAVRLSLGASRGRLVRQLVTESAALAALGGIAAMGVAALLHDVLVDLLTGSHPDLRVDFALDPSMLAFLVVATLAAALVFGALPALLVTRGNTGAYLKDQGRSGTSTRATLRMGRILASAQLALSLPLLVGAGLLARTVYNLQHTDLGFPADHLLLVRVDLDAGGYEGSSRDRALRDLLGGIRTVPGVRNATYSELGIFSGGESGATIAVEGYTPAGRDDRDSAFDIVGPEYFSALGIPIVLGREIQERDTADVCVINEAFARRFFSGRSAIGRRITMVNDAERPSFAVIGVARDAHTQGLRDEVSPRFFVRTKQPSLSVPSPTFLIRTATRAPSMLSSIRERIRQVNAAIPLLSAATIEDQMAPLTAQDRATAQLVVAFGGVALLLAAIGLYGVLSYGVVRRTAEIAIRLALGAQASRVIAMILRETSAVVAVGLLAGGGLAYSAARLIDSRLFGVAPQDPFTLAIATGLLVFVALFAAYLPARRASRLDPMAVLRQG